MKVQFKLTIGENEFILTEDVASNAEFFQKLHFYSTLPKVGPNGETDLVLTYRTPQNYEYYSIVSEKAGQEFKFGQHKDKPGSLFAKGWEPIYKSEEGVTQGGGLGQPTAAPAQTQGLGQVAAPAPAPAQAPAQTTPAVDNTTGVNAAPQVTAAPAQNQAANAQIQQKANDVLSKFGI